MSDNVISYQRWPSCQHQQFIVDESLNTVECAKCGEKLNPIWVLEQLANDERHYKNTLRNIKAEADKASEKNRCKCEHCGKMTRIQK